MATKKIFTDMDVTLFFNALVSYEIGMYAPRVNGNFEVECETAV